MSVPEQPWERGRQEYTLIGVNVQVCEDADGTVWSLHQVDPEDEPVAKSMDSGGNRQVAHALLVEALRREVFVEVLIEMSSDKDWLSRYQTVSKTDQDGMTKNLSNSALAVMVGVIPKLLPGVVQEVLDMVITQK